MATLNVYVDIEPMSKIQNMPRVSPSLCHGTSILIITINIP